MKDKIQVFEKVLNKVSLVAEFTDEVEAEKFSQYFLAVTGTMPIISGIGEEMPDHYFLQAQ